MTGLFVSGGTAVGDSKVHDLVHRALTMNILPAKAHVNVGKVVMKALAKDDTSTGKEKAFIQIVRRSDRIAMLFKRQVILKMNDLLCHTFSL